MSEEDARIIPFPKRAQPVEDMPEELLYALADLKKTQHALEAAVDNVRGDSRRGSRWIAELKLQWRALLYSAAFKKAYRAMKDYYYNEGEENNA